MVPSPVHGGAYASSQSTESIVTSHSITLTGLNSNTEYYFRVGSNDPSDNGPSTSNELSFTTDPPDITPPVISNVLVASKTDTTAVIEWTTDEPSNSFFQYGTFSSSWGSYPYSQNNSSMVTSHSITLAGLNSNTTYYYRLGSMDARNNGPTISNELSFTTDPTPGTDTPSMVQFPVIDYNNATIDVTFSESNMQNATTEANYSFSPSLLFESLGGSDDIASIGSSTYRLSFASVPNNLIYTLTVSNITDADTNLVTPSSIKINDNDNDGIADDWEGAHGISDASEDADGDGLTNLEEYNNSTNPNNADTDGDSLPDGWETTYGLDPNDNTGDNGRNGDPDGDTWTNYQEYLNGYHPNNINSPEATTPNIKKTLPQHNSGITNGRRIPIDSSFAVRIEDPDGIDITDTTSIKFTVDDGINPVYERDLSDTAVVRVVMLTPDPDTRVNNAWVVYDRSLDSLGNFPYDADVNIKVDMSDKRGTIMPQESFDFNIETEEEHDLAQSTRPETTSDHDAGMITLSPVNSPEIDGFHLVYDSTEPIIPLIEPLDEVPPLDMALVTSVGQPVELGPPNVFNNPVTLVLPITGVTDVKELSVFLYDGTEWVYAVSSYNSGGVIQPSGEDWVIPGSLTYDDTGATPVLKVQVYHFSAIQTGIRSLPSISSPPAAGGGGGGCFIDTVNPGASIFSSKKDQMRMWLLAILSLIALVVLTARKARQGER